MDAPARASVAAAVAAGHLAVAYPVRRWANAPPYDAPAWGSWLYAYAFVAGWCTPRGERRRAAAAFIVGGAGIAGLALFLLGVLVWRVLA